MTGTSVRSAIHTLLGAVVVVGTAGIMGSISGCYAGVDYEPAPPNIETYPSYTYEGHATYFYNNHWYYREGGGRWVAYRNEPAELRAHRPMVRANVNVHENVNVREGGERREEVDRHEERR